MAEHGHVLGIDTHKHVHVAVVLTGLGRVVAETQVEASDTGSAALLVWAAANGAPRIAGVEGTGSYGYRLTRELQAAGMTVLEVNRPDRANRRRKGKSDPVDAEAAARAVLSGQATAVPKNREGVVESLRALTLARNSAVKATTAASNQMKALLVGADQELRDALSVKSLLQLATLAGGLAPSSGIRAALGSLGKRWLGLHDEIVELDVLIRDIVKRTLPELLARPGVGIHSAAQLLITAGGNPERLHSDAAFAALCGASPVQASSGQKQRHRLSRGGDRAANHALWTIANNRLIHDTRTQAPQNCGQAISSTKPSAIHLAHLTPSPTPARECCRAPKHL